MDAGVEFVACDNPHATRLTLHILAAVAEHEREMIAARTKAALQAAKGRGVRPGRNGAERLAPANHAAAVDRANQIRPLLAELTGAGMSTRQIAAELSARSIPTPRGGRWHQQAIVRLMKTSLPPGGSRFGTWRKRAFLRRFGIAALDCRDTPQASE